MAVDGGVPYGDMHEHPAQPPIMMIEDVAQRWGKSSQVIRDWARKGAFPGAFHIGRIWVIPRASVLELERADAGAEELHNTA